MAWTLRVEDTFTDTGLTDLESHTPETGSGWDTDVAGGYRINIGGTTLDCVNGGSAENLTVLGNDQAAEYTAAADIDNQIGYLFCRWDASAGDAYAAYYEYTANQLSLVRFDSGTPTTLDGPHSVTLVDSDVVRLECVGTTIRVLLNTAEVLSATDATHSSGSVGVGFGVNNQLITSFRAYDDAGSGGGPIIHELGPNGVSGSSYWKLGPA